MRVIDEEKIIENIKNISKKNEIIMVLKDNAYGVGICRMVNIAKICNIKRIAVKTIDEGILVRFLYRECEILVLGKINKSQIKEVKKHNLIPTINDYSDYVIFKDNGIKSHLEIDAGMNRFGIKNNYLAIINDPIVDKIYIHIYDEGEINKIEFIKRISKRFNKPFHIGGSIVLEHSSDIIRVGKAMYSGALSFYGTITNIKKVYQGETVGYDKCYYANSDCWIGICDVGYKNGLSIQYNGKVYINGNYYSIVGKSCMDHVFVLINENVSIGDKVEFLGANISEKDFLHWNKMTFYEALLFLN